MLYITEQAKLQIIEAGIISFPKASVGFLLGFEKRDIRIIEKVVISDSPADTTINSALSPQQQEDAALLGAENGLSVLGIFCTLPNKPSSPDFINYPAELPDYYSILLLSVWGGDFISLQSWRQNQHYKIVEEKIAIVHDQYYEPILRKDITPFGIHYN